MKKTYIIPTIEVIEFDAENMIAMSVGTGDDTVGAGGALSNKREPVVNSWSSSNWNTEEEF